MEVVLPENVFYNFEDGDKPLSQDGKFILVINDVVNCYSYPKWYNTIEEAVDYLMKTIFNTNKSVSEMKTDTLYIFEKDGRLYEGWTDYSLSYPLFEKYTEEKPRTIIELENWLKNQNYVRVSWYDRAPVDYFVLSRDEFQKSYLKWNEECERLAKEDDEDN